MVFSLRSNVVPSSRKKSSRCPREDLKEEEQKKTQQSAVIGSESTICHLLISDDKVLSINISHSTPAVIIDSSRLERRNKPK